MNTKDLFDTTIQIDLADAAAKGDTNKLKLLIASGADVNCQGHRGMKPLFWALINQNFRGFKFLLDHGADPNAVVAIVQPPPENALTLAASVDDSKYLEELLKHGANPNLPAGNPSPETAIFTASFYHQTNNISILLHYGADINWKTTDAMTPLHRAISGNSFATALFLYRAGANPLIKDKWGYDPIDTLKKFGDNGVVSHTDKVAYKQLLEEFRKNGFLDKPDAK
jgi:ankyrin repeat protein